LEIVFVSSDSDDGSFNEYYGSMPWVSVPFSNKNISQALGQKFSVRGIPSLIVLSATDARIIDRDGRSTVSSSKGDISKCLGNWAL
jgi:nucleoredoxin